MSAFVSAFFGKTNRPVDSAGGGGGGRRRGAMGFCEEGPPWWIKPAAGLVVLATVLLGSFWECDSNATTLECRRHQDQVQQGAYIAGIVGALLVAYYLYQRRNKKEKLLQKQVARQTMDGASPSLADDKTH